MKKRIILTSTALALLTLFACDELQNEDNASEDIIRETERRGKTLICATAEPFTTLSFNYDKSGTGIAPIGNGNISYRYPSEADDKTDIVKRTAATPEATAEETKFILTNGMQGNIKPTENGICEQDMFSEEGANVYLYEVTKFPGGASSQYTRKGCCKMR